ncbi:MAG: DUF5017 domain-containing protein [Chlorobi bacterium]|nr:DUF5017 domain-containing protein [Chlorobiota bacterium]
MKKTYNIYIKLITVVAFITVMTGCVDKNDTPPDLPPFTPGTIVPISEIHEMYGGEMMQITDNISIAGTIVMDDAQGNLYKEVVIQDTSSGLFILLDTSKGLLQGDSVVINCKGLYLDDYNGLLQLGGVPYTDLSGNKRLSGFNADDKSKKYAINLETHPKVMSIEELNAGDYQGQLVKLEHVEFIKTLIGRTYADAENLQAMNRPLVDCGGNTTIVRTSGYAYFADSLLPTGNGSIIGVVSVYRDTKQLLIRHLRDVNMNYTRCEDGGGVDGDVLIFENFNNLGRYGDFDIPGWLAVAETGSKNWYGDGYDGTTAEISAYNSGDDSNIAWMVTPAIELSGYDNYIMDFLTGYKYWKGDILDVLISTDYNGNGEPWTATWTKLEARIATEGDPTYDQTGGYISSGEIDLSAYNGSSVYIAFRYNGSGNDGLTTKYRVDNFRVYAN